MSSDVRGGPLRVLWANATSVENALLRILVTRLEGQVAFEACTFDGPGPLDAQLADLGVRLHHLPSAERLNLPRAAVAISRLLRRTGPDLVHANLFGPGIATELARLQRSAPASVFTRHHDRSHHLLRKPLHVRADRWTARHASHVIAPSAAVRETLVGDERVPADHVTVVHHGVEWDRLAADDDERRRWRATFPPGPLAVAAGRLDPIKAYPDLLDALASSRRSVPSLHLAIAGAGAPGARESLEEAIGQRDLGDAVTLLGHVRDLAPLVAAADVFVQASHAESFGLAVLEAAGLGVPLAVTTPGGIAEITAGIAPSVAPGDIAALAARIIDVLRDPSARVMAEATAASVRARFSAESMAAGHLKVYERTVAQRS